MKRAHLLRGLVVATLLAAGARPASAQLFGDGPSFLCTTLSIGCPPPPPPPPAPPPPVVEPPPVKKAHHARKAKPKVKAVAAPKADSAPKAAPQ